jgi:gelsolin
VRLAGDSVKARGKGKVIDVMSYVQCSLSSFFSLGDESTQDEYGTAAYKMVELDDKLHGVAVQHREVQGKESDKFAKYFDYKMTYLKGGVETGFTHVEATKEEPHLYRLKGVNKTQMTLTQLPVRRDQMNAGDVFVLVAGDDHVWLWIGAESNNYEKTSKLVVRYTYIATSNSGGCF